MRTKKELDELSEMIANATFAYHAAIFDNLKESGKEYDVIPDDDDDDEEHNGLRLTIIGRHDESVDICVDKVRYAKRKSGVELIEVHVCEEDYEERDYWCDVDTFGYDEDYVFNNIKWEK